MYVQEQLGQYQYASSFGVQVVHRPHIAVLLIPTSCALNNFHTTDIASVGKGLGASQLIFELVSTVDGISLIQ